MWAEFALEGLGFSRAVESCQGNAWPLGPDGWGRAENHPSAAKAEAVFALSIGTAKAVPFQSRGCSRFQIQMRLPCLDTTPIKSGLTHRARIKAIVEFDLKSLPVPVTAYTQHFYFAFGGKSVSEEQHNGTRHSKVVQRRQGIWIFEP